jgi:hypothetical protein
MSFGFELRKLRCVRTTDLKLFVVFEAERETQMAKLSTIRLLSSCRTEFGPVDPTMT